MGFESLFLISLLITFGAIVFIIYHFKHNINSLESKCNTMFDIINCLAKDVRDSKQMASTTPSHNISQPWCPDNNSFNQVVEDTGKIVVSDDEEEDDSDVDEVDDIKVINVDVDTLEDNQDNYSLEDINNDEVDVDEDVDVDVDEVDVDEVDVDDVDEVDVDVDVVEKEDYKKMDISYLRTLVITRGLATDTKKMRKNELIKLLEK